MSKTSRRLIFALMKDRMTPAARMTGHTQRGQCAKRMSILDAAADVFCRQGFAGASIDEIAAVACVSRQTIYNHYREKETLFVAVVEDVMNRANAMLFSVLSTFPDRVDNLEDELTAFAVRLNKNCICNHDGKFLRKLVQTEGERYPHLFESWRQQGPGKLTTALSALFARLAHKQALVIDDFDVAARQFVALGNADLQMMILLGATPTDEELEKAARNAVRTFLKAYGRPEAEKAGHPPQLAAISG
ncbi:TetR/AcrR family transcriptional regulator [Rhizobium ruizarguesonis]|uniref:TetR/AcrR family transcriptional regulator n=1 Tax=Rhizobium ruizarguesonis TaxID=2081791 RepID=UPI00102F7870|nr:TetR/AcrR family transcriptional regulator [Rhizobium ruizarguesonis]MBY5893631.1 TetR/AcrR family transcriptional regulator [Rhizobium leguminosarum]QND23374.1 TetR/AcrR family transcriptional regulator [Rhizobium leguminosarum bv. viciae]NEI25703.1 TetR family transcriptional regulator [Rhizobium ruizarguesonis]TBA10937.1 TetR/AcrR family transcriptional regulator [Rhizobium ruizarguesonis]TBA52110.1 TetR/AcrR family transcriptional regulator [Rhizobium ruizarguesonis]